MGRPPIGKRAMTAAERQRRHRGKQVFRDKEPTGSVTKPKTARSKAKEVRERDWENLKKVPRMRGLTRKEVDPDFVETFPAAFATKYGHVLTRTKQQIEQDEASERAAKLSVWLKGLPTISRADLAAYRARDAYRASKLDERLAAAVALLTDLAKP